ncbi:hypothetical protein CC78DRAFT_238442 [Lojkania enalia]|uniref:NACHT-NTPase and P-loop NTPases N-terminal domain-containing protein n=1 Tax=Lojkania enalia TaxID=147567 RepID=A0A9P4NAM6_9PLEO|nr:hypothetical protein CC78DRAFT_238442 [Didymosphaeria enalia]
MSGLEEASAIIGVVAFVVDIAGKTWNFLSKMKSAPTEAFDIAQDLYLVSSICVKISLILDEKDEMFQFAYKTLQKLCLEIDNLNLVGQKELEKIISKDTEGDTRIEKNSKSTRTSVTKRYIWAWNDEQRKYLLGRVESAKSCFLMLLKQNEFKYFKE